MDVEPNILTSKDIWVPLVAAIVGGALSLLGSFFALWLANKHSVKQEEEADKKRGAELAYGAFHKLLEAHNSAANLQRQIHEMFENADNTEGGELEPWAKVMELVGSDRVVQAVTPNETAFLIGTGRAELLNNVHLIDRRLMNIEACSVKYNEQRAEFWVFAEKNLSETEIGEGTRIAAEFEGNAGRMADARVMRLNNLLGQLMEFLERDVNEAWSIIEQFHAAATLHFGTHYPKFNLEKAAL